MRRLYLQIYASFVILALIITVSAGLLAWAARAELRRVPRFFSGTIEMIAERLPPPVAPRAMVQARLETLAHRLHVDASLWDAHGRILASVGAALPPPRLIGGGRAGGEGHEGSERAVWMHRRGGPPGIVVHLNDGRWLALRLKQGHGGHRGMGWLLRFAVLALVMAAGAYPVARHIARRLERLRAGVEDFGAGHLSARVAVEGQDEVAEVARSFNKAASRIQTLVNAQKRLLGNASHELRSPLARLSVAVELMGKEVRPELRDEAETDIAELDALIEDLLLAARLDAPSGELEGLAPVELLGLLSEESGRVQATAIGGPLTVTGDERLLRRMLRNLLENARLHGGPGNIEATLTPLEEGKGARITVADRGPGVPENARDKVFEPFYRGQGVSHGRGAGLGLALVRDIARCHRGEARCLPRDGGGAIFEVEIPSAG